MKLWRSLLVGLGLAFAAPAQAEGDEDEERARRLFEEGFEARDRGDHEAACAKFSESLELFRRASTLLNLGACHEQLGHTATALGFWVEGAALLPSDDKRMEIARAHAAELEERAPRLHIVLPNALPALAVLTLDGRELSTKELDEVLRLDPGPHQLRLSAPEHHPVEVDFELADGDDREQALVLEPIDGGPVAAPRPTPPPEPAPLVAGGDLTPPHRVPVWVWPVGGVGVTAGAIAVGLGADYGLTLSRQREACGGDLLACRPDPPGSYDPNADNARKTRDAVAGVVLGATGASLLTIAIVGAAMGEEAPMTVALAPGPTSLWITGAF
ncbi:MAG: tetratricopeptide repeat protein [Polyangiaceae bacterium]